MPGKIKLLVFTALWKRPHIARICFHGINRLRRHPDYDITAFAVISEKEMIPLCEEFGVKWLMHDNQPLGRKKNAGLMFCQRFDFDWMMEIGSDDLVLNSLLDDYKPLTERHPFFGICDICFVDSTDGECNRYVNRQTMFGAGRMIRRDVLQRHKWKIWPDDAVNVLDGKSLSVITEKFNIPYTMLRPIDYPQVIDIKSEVGIWPFEAFRGVKYDITDLYEHLSSSEITLIEACYKHELISEGVTS